jgi:hypothetical protein
VADPVAWEPTMKSPYVGMCVWPVPENKENYFAYIYPQCCGSAWIRIRLKGRIRIRIRINLQMTSKNAVLRIHDILGWIRIRIRGSMPLTTVMDSDPAILSLTFKMPANY